jgi:hypothetical protein
MVLQWTMEEVDTVSEALDTARFAWDILQKGAPVVKRPDAKVRVLPKTC